MSAYAVDAMSSRRQSPVVDGARPRGPRHTVSWTATTVLLILGIVLILGPLYIAVVVALKTPAQMANVLSVPTLIRWQNFADAWRLTNFPSNFRNTLLITAVNLVFTLFTNSMAAYAIARNRRKHRVFNILYYYFLSAMFIPFNVLMLPLTKEVTSVGLGNVYGLTFLYIVLGLPMNTFLYVRYIDTIPVALDEAATIDGASAFNTFRYIVFPLMKPMHACVAIMSFMWTWNDFLMPLVILPTDPNQQTLQLSQYVFQGQFSTNYNLAFASYLMVMLPVIVAYVVMQRWIIAGVTEGAMK
jgi:raffinose/stachyose/melibiose transport system permease protein